MTQKKEKDIDEIILADIDPDELFDSGVLAIITDISTKLNTAAAMMEYFGWAQPLDSLLAARRALLKIADEEKKILINRYRC